VLEAVSENLTPEEEAALKELARVVVSFRRIGKITFYVIGGILGTIVLVTQAWSGIKMFFMGKI
jgi:hypothetical protein